MLQGTLHTYTYIYNIHKMYNMYIYIYIHPTIAKGSSSLNLRKRTPFGSSQDASPFVELIIIVYNCIYLRSVLSLNILTNKRNKYYKYIYIYTLYELHARVLPNRSSPGDSGKLPEFNGRVPL